MTTAKLSRIIRNPKEGMRMSYKVSWVLTEVSLKSTESLNFMGAIVNATTSELSIEITDGKYRVVRDVVSFILPIQL